MLLLHRIQDLIGRVSETKSGFLDMGSCFGLVPFCKAALSVWLLDSCQILWALSNGWHVISRLLSYGWINKNQDILGIPTTLLRTTYYFLQPCQGTDSRCHVPGQPPWYRHVKWRVCILRYQLSVQLAECFFFFAIPFYSQLDHIFAKSLSCFHIHARLICFLTGPPKLQFAKVSHAMASGGSPCIQAACPFGCLGRSNRSESTVEVFLHYVLCTAMHIEIFKYVGFI